MEARHSALCAGEAEEVVKELRAALAKAGITPPSPGPDPVSPAREAPRPLVEPGRCSVGTARRTAAVVR
ncbi:hypothetical protein RM528_24310 [Streptomyces sp. DSM 41635]|uniref:Uncharacterized protein n=1 Tax=Streptomyces edwardsiae TaxID=3075527 RepID=A0ABU2QKI1_9ACTN|nr:hypothetical protein [Streptomyces sp. DSM 41635]MDT0404966.1 hypothetical protein [Streptomyces sp. DSM 41635]